MDLSESLLALATAVDADGGQRVRRLLRGLLGEEAPFDAGEIVLPGEGGLQRWSLEPGTEQPIAGEDLLSHVRASGLPLRVDTRAEAEAFPETAEHMRACGLDSLLALPLGGGPGPPGILLLARRHGWAFVGASLPTLLPLAAMAGLAMQQAVSLTSLRERADALEAAARPDAAAVARRTLAAARQALETARQAAVQEGKQKEEALRRAEEGEAARREAVGEGQLLRAQVEKERGEAQLREAERDQALAERAALQEALQEKGAEAKATAARLRAQEEEIQGGRAVRAELEEKLREGGEREKGQEGELASLRRELAAHQEAALSRAPLEGELARERSEKERFQAEAASARHEQERLGEELSALRIQAAGWNQALEAERSRAMDLGVQLEETTSAREALRTAVGEQQRHLEELEAMLLRAGDELDLARGERATALAAADEAGSTLAAALTRSQELEAALREATENSRALSQRVERWRAAARAAGPSLRRNRAAKGKAASPRRPVRGRG